MLINYREHGLKPIKPDFSKGSILDKSCFFFKDGYIPRWVGDNPLIDFEKVEAALIFQTKRDLKTYENIEQRMNEAEFQGAALPLVVDDKAFFKVVNANKFFTAFKENSKFG